MQTKIALCQLNPMAGEPEINLQTIEKALAKCSKKNVSLAIFPEDFLFGVLRDRKKILNAGKNFNIWIKRLSDLAQEYKVDLIPGSLPLYRNKNLFNTTVYIDSKGRVLNQYEKVNLWISEREEYTPSSAIPKVFNSILGKTAQIICWDLMNHRLFEEAVKQGVEWIINVSLWSTNQSRDLKRIRGTTKNKYYNPLSRSERLNEIIEVRSHEYDLGLIFCNIGGAHKYTAMDKLPEQARSAGCTQVIAPLDAVRTIVKDRKEHILICDVPDIKTNVSDHEILWGRREDVINKYPYKDFHV